MNTLVEIGPPLGAALVVLLLAAVLVSRLGQLGHDKAIAVAAGRAVVQLALVALVLAAVVRSLALTLLFVLGMYAVASWTGGRRLARTRAAWWAALPIGVGTLPVVGLAVAVGVVPARGIAIVPVAGILIGGAMTATSLAGRRALEEMRARRGEYEAGLSLGLLSRDSALELCRPAGAQALLPVLDQTRTVGLVALPGAFVGTLLGGASPAEAGAVQVLILVALLAVEATAVVVTTELVARGTFPWTTQHTAGSS